MGRTTTATSCTSPPLPRRQRGRVHGRQRVAVSTKEGPRRTADNLVPPGPQEIQGPSKLLRARTATCFGGGAWIRAARLLYDLTDGKEPTIPRLMESWRPIREESSTGRPPSAGPCLFTDSCSLPQPREHTSRGVLGLRGLHLQTDDTAAARARAALNRGPPVVRTPTQMLPRGAGRSRWTPRNTRGPRWRRRTCTTWRKNC